MKLLPAFLRGDASRPRINRRPSRIIARMTPWITVMLGSLLPGMALIASAPVLPPFGSAVLLFSAAAIALDVIEARLPWRNFLTEWLVAIGLVILYIAIGLALANLSGAHTPLRVTWPQIVISVLAYPLVGRFVALADRFRLTPFMEIR